jgi:hypothetical protein
MFKLREAENQIVLDYEVSSRSYRVSERSSAIEFLMWYRRRRWVISPLILAAPRGGAGQWREDA